MPVGIKEHHHTDRIGWLRAAVLGANDGILSTSSLVLGVAAAQATHRNLLIAGMAGLVAGAMSMAAGEYVSVHSQADICALSAERGVTTSSGFSPSGPLFRSGVSFCSSTIAGRRYRAAGPLPPCTSRPLSTRLFSQRWRVRCGTPFRAAAISPLRAPLVLCRTKSTTAARSSAMSPTRRFATIRPLLIA